MTGLSKSAQLGDEPLERGMIGFTGLVGDRMRADFDNDSHSGGHYTIFSVDFPTAMMYSFPT